MATLGDALAFCQWFQSGGLRDGYLTDDCEILPILDKDFNKVEMSERARNDGLRPFNLLVRQIPYAEISITTQPSGVVVF